MNLLKKSKPGYGKQNVVALNEGGLKKIVFDLLKLKSGESWPENTGGYESAFIILTGTCTFKGDGFEYKSIGSRQDVFSGKPASVYLPANTAYEITAETEVEIAICSSVSQMKSAPVYISPDDVREVNLGILNWKRKAHFIVDHRINSESLYLGETFLSPGKWAFPPHRHDKDNLPEEVDMEEIYHYRVNPASGFGIQLSYTDDRSRDEAYLLRNGDTVILPDGYHPASASPVDSLYILWMMAGEKRYFLSRPEDEYKWVPRCENFLKSMS